jgi:hypothetical protein
MWIRVDPDLVDPDPVDPNPVDPEHLLAYRTTLHLFYDCFYSVVLTDD